jgi:hypothetical protein
LDDVWEHEIQEVAIMVPTKGTMWVGGVLRSRYYGDNKGKHHYTRTYVRVIAKYTRLWNKGISVGSLRLSIHRRGFEIMYNIQ